MTGNHITKKQKLSVSRTSCIQNEDFSVFGLMLGGTYAGKLYEENALFEKRLESVLCGESTRLVFILEFCVS